VKQPIGERVGQRGVFPDAGEYIVLAMGSSFGVVDVVCGDQRETQAMGYVNQCGHAQVVAWLQVALQLGPETPVKDLAQVICDRQGLAKIAALQGGRHSALGTSGQADQAGSVLSKGV